MKFVLKPSLEHMTLVKIVISFWNQNDVSALISKLSYGDLFDAGKWDAIEERILEKVPQLSLPQLLKEKIFGVIKPIGLHLLEWKKYYDRYTWMGLHRTCFPAHLQAELRWTPQGKVDRKRTAEALIKDESLDVSSRYILACDYCLEDDIHKFWNSVPEALKDYDWNNFPVICFWSDNMKRGRVGHVSYKDVFYQSAFGGNKVAAEYFLQKLTPHEKEETMIEAAKCAYKTEVFYFLISKMNEEQQMLVFKSDPYGALRFFLQWPFQSFFIRVANCMWDSLPELDYYSILRAIIYKVRDGYKDCNYQMLFSEFWQKSPNALKCLITNKIHTSWLLPSLFDIKDKENIRLILKDTTFTAKEKLIYSNGIASFCRSSIRENEWDFLEFCIRECFPSKNEMLKFKEQFEKHMCPYFKEHHFSTIKRKWDGLFYFSDNSICKCDKRSLEEGESSSSKQFRSLQ